MTSNAVDVAIASPSGYQQRMARDMWIAPVTRRYQLMQTSHNADAAPDPAGMPTRPLPVSGHFEVHFWPRASVRVTVRNASALFADFCV